MASNTNSFTEFLISRTIIRLTQELEALLASPHFQQLSNFVYEHMLPLTFIYVEFRYRLNFLPHNANISSYRGFPAFPCFSCSPFDWSETYTFEKRGHYLLILPVVFPWQLLSFICVSCQLNFFGTHHFCLPFVVYWNILYLLFHMEWFLFRRFCG